MWKHVQILLNLSVYLISFLIFYTSNCFRQAKKINKIILLGHNGQIQIQNWHQNLFMFKIPENFSAIVYIGELNKNVNEYSWVSEDHILPVRCQRFCLCSTACRWGSLRCQWGVCPNSERQRLVCSTLPAGWEQGQALGLVRKLKEENRN